MPIVASAEMNAAYLSGAVAILALIVSLLTTALTLRHQRTLAEEARNSDRRADAYIRLIEYQRQNPTFDGLLPAEVGSRFIAYGSEEVNKLFEEVRRARNDSDQAFGAAMDALLGQIRFELQGRRDSDVLNVTTRWERENG